MGKSRFAPLVKLKKKSLEQAERALVAVNNEVADATGRVERAYDILSTLSLPASGSVHELSQANLLIQMQHSLIEQSKENLSSLQQKRDRMRQEFHEARIEYEKFKYLEIREMNEKIKQMKATDAKLLDEIGTMMYKKESL